MNSSSRLQGTSRTLNASIVSRVITVILLLLAVTVIPGAASTLMSCPGCTNWTDTCAIFEKNNETAYNAAIEASFAPIAANMTPTADYRTLSWTEAFVSLNALMKERYAFTKWRAVDFDLLNATWEPVIADADNRQDKAAYLRALRGYLYEIPDGHVNLLPVSGDFGAKYADIGGGFGIALVQLDAGDVMVSYVANGSAAEKAGIRSGDIVTAWNGAKIHAAINATSHIWVTKKPSTEEGIHLQKTRLLTRAPVGSTASITIVNRFDHMVRSVNLTAYDDGYDSLIKSSFFLGKQINDIGAADALTGIAPQLSPDTVTTRTLPGGYTYIEILDESYDAYQPFRAAMLAAIANKTPGVVIDLRWNGGGEDDLAACFGGWFVDKPVFYEYVTMYDPGTGQFTPLSKSWTQPRPVRYDGPVAVLVSPDTISSGEGLPMVFTKTGRGAIISWYGTDGAFGMNGFQAIMPLDMYVLFPAGASLDENGTIQVDSNAFLAGGVAPTVRVPLNEETVGRAMAGEDVQMTYAMKWLDGQNITATPAAPATPTPKAAMGMVAILVAVGMAVMIAKRN